MRQYLQLMETVLTFGREKKDRTGTGTLSMFAPQMRFDLTEGFPLVTTKKVHLRSIIHELLWFLKGDTNIGYLKDNNVSIWDEWSEPKDTFKDVELTQEERMDAAIALGLWKNGRGALREKLHVEGPEKGSLFLDNIGVKRNKQVLDKRAGDLGPVYGKQWRDWVGADGRHHDQISKVIDQLRNDPDNRRIIVSAWNVGELDEMALAPCHSFFQFYTRELTLYERALAAKEKGTEDYYLNLNEKHQEQLHYEFDELAVPRRGLSCQLYQRSADVFLGVPFNIASYALLTEMIAQQVNMVAEEFVWTGGDTHLYSNHLEQARLQLSRDPHPLPRLKFKRKPESIFDYQFEDFEVEGYVSHDAIKAPVAI